MNIINKFAKSLGMPVVNLNIYQMSLCLCSKEPVTDSRVWSVVFHCTVWSEEHFLTGCSYIKLCGDYTSSGSLQRNLPRTLLLRETR